MPYTHFRMIAYEVPTASYDAKAGGPVVAGWDPGKLCPEVARARIPANLNLSQDAINRLRRLASVVDEAAQGLAALGDDNNTLKIFMVPEFYFRPTVLGPTYVSNTYPDTEVFQIVRALDGMFSHADFQHWLFICGTVMWNSSSDPFRPTIYYNTAVYKRGGIQNTAGSISMVEKQLASAIDAIPMASAPGYNDSVRMIFESWANRRLRVFDHDGIACGLEVCLDHADHDMCRALRRVLEDWPEKEGARQEVKLHLLTAGGMPINDWSVSAKVGGYILRNDGLYWPQGQSELRQVTGYRTMVNPLTGVAANRNQIIKGVRLQATMNAVAPESERDLFGAKLVGLPGLTYRVFPQRIVYYPRLGVPA